MFALQRPRSVPLLADGVFARGAMALRFSTIAVSDAIGQGHAGMRASLVSREVIADSVELMAESERLIISSPPPPNVPSK